PDRIAVFDNDGTLWTERPVYAQLAFALDREPELGHPASPDQLRAGGLGALVELVKLTHTGISTDQFAAVCRPELIKGDAIQVINDGPQKPSSIHAHVGQRPILAAGNTDGDLAMLQWTAASSPRTWRPTGRPST